MIISHEKRFVMLRPWKTASQSMTVRLTPYNESPYDPFFHFNGHLNRVVHQHVTLADYSRLPVAGQGYFTAAFVRNPYDRVYSGFRQLQKDIAHQPHLPFPEPWIRDLVMTQLSENFAQLCKARFQFDQWLDLVDDHQIHEAGRNSNFPLHPAHYWTHLDGQLAVDFVGRVENFEADFESFLSLVRIGPIDRVNENVEDLEGNASTNPAGYRYVDRMNARSIEKINRLFDRDFEFFGYKCVA